ncbi:MAG: hypothetical protein ACLS34_04880 [Faecalibacterium sp.]
MKHRIVTAAQMEGHRTGRKCSRPALSADDGEHRACSLRRTEKRVLPQPGSLLVVCGKGNNGGTVLSSPAPLQKRAGKWEVVILHDIWNSWHGCSNCGKCP